MLLVPFLDEILGLQLFLSKARAKLLLGRWRIAHRLKGFDFIFESPDPLCQRIRRIERDRIFYGALPLSLRLLRSLRLRRPPSLIFKPLLLALCSLHGCSSLILKLPFCCLLRRQRTLKVRSGLLELCRRPLAPLPLEHIVLNRGFALQSSQSHVRLSGSGRNLLQSADMMLVGWLPLELARLAQLELLAIVLNLSQCTLQLIGVQGTSTILVKGVKECVERLHVRLDGQTFLDALPELHLAHHTFALLVPIEHQLRCFALLLNELHAYHHLARAPLRGDLGILFGMLLADLICKRLVL